PGEGLPCRPLLPPSGFRAGWGQYTKSALCRPTRHHQIPGRPPITGEVWQLSDLSPLASLAQLTTLYLWNCPQLSDLSPLASLTQLTLLDLRNCKQVSGITPLAGLSHLTTLDLRGNRRRIRAGRLRGLEALPQRGLVW